MLEFARYATIDRSDGGEWISEMLSHKEGIQILEKNIDEMSVPTTRINQVSSIVVELLEVFFHTLLTT